MEGQFTFLVATSLPTDSVRVCSIGVMGTTYIRDEDLAESIEVEVGGTVVLTVPHIRAEDDIGNTLAINLRQREGDGSTRLFFVSFAEESDHTKVIVDGLALTAAAGTEYTLVIESFDTNSNGVESTLKTDSIEILIIDPIEESTFFSEELEPESMISGEEKDWTLPSIEDPLASV